MRWAQTLCTVALSACGFSISGGNAVIDAGDGGADAPDGSAPDAMIDAIPIDAPTTSGWIAPVLVDIPDGDDPTLTDDLLQIWLERDGDIYHASRANVLSAFGAVTKVDALSTADPETTPEVAPNGSSMTLARTVGGNTDIYISTFAGGTWTAAIPITDINSSASDTGAVISGDRTMLAMTSTKSGNPDIYISTRASVTMPWGTPVAATELNSAMHDGSAFLANNKLMICFDTLRASTQNDIYCARRTTPGVPFDPPLPLTAINSASRDEDPWLSADGRTIVFWSDRDGTSQLYLSRFL